ncbi:YrhK family protein [Salinarimonas ramus]|uniref:YrhK domain-containing protein n=1 Tax=Salinarimonas ramus TaxID=690164 RepID=A0A917QK95_9HYPH|nr:YrhK family protein [Salinarimonas ramus]GGK54606.1 hypothetical protein GCM10011322_46730 [Salinarimonas ramus]
MLVRDYPYVHLAIGIFGNTAFLVGSVLFFERFSHWHHTAVWLFVIGAAGMLVGALGKAAKDIYEHVEKKRKQG